MPTAESFTSRRGGIRRRARRNPGTSVVVTPQGQATRLPTARAIGYAPPGVSPRTSEAAAIHRGLSPSVAARNPATASLNAALASLSPAQRSLAPFAIQAAREVGDVPASVLLALSGQESNYGQNQGPSSAGARGVTQFIPSTRASFIKEYGVDPWADPKQAFKATALYLKELDFKKDPQGALSGYSGGYSSGAYNNPILTNARNFRQLDTFAGRAGVNPRLAKRVARRPASVAELFYDPGISLKDGQPTSPIGGHGTHVHVASNDPRAEKRFINIARKRFGLNVGENVFVGNPPDPGVHVSDSYHYKEAKLPSGRPIDLGADITGSPQAMAAYDRFIARKFGNNPQVAAGNFGSSGAGAAALGGFSAGYGGPVPVGASGTAAGNQGISAPAPPAYPIASRTGVAALPTLPTDLSSISNALASIIGGTGQAPADDSVLAQILSRSRRFKPRR